MTAQLYTGTMKTVLTTLLLSFMVSVSAAQQTPTCDEQEIVEYITEPQFPASCDESFFIVQNGTVAVQPSALDDALNILCTEDCGGQISKWFLNNCNDIVGGHGLYYSCLDPGNTAPDLSRCRYASDPYFDVGSFLRGPARPCRVANQVNPCPDGCSQTLTNLTMRIGCCFQGFYNDTEYLQDLVSAGFAPQELLQELQTFRNPGLWAACQVTPPSSCTIEGIEFPSATTTTTTTTTTQSTTRGAAFMIVQSTLTLVVLLLTSALFA